MALATLNIIGYVTVKAWECLALFSLAGYSAHCYCKNVSLAILAALFVANFVFGCGRVKEGFEDALAGPVEKMTEASSLLREAAMECRLKDGETLPEGQSCAGTDAASCSPADKCDWLAAQVQRDATAIAAAENDTACTAAGGNWTATAAKCVGGTAAADPYEGEQKDCEGSAGGQYTAAGGSCA
jgi:hypothetical protein